jgi:hypothetical protein
MGNLPPELRIQILFKLTDFASLRSLVHASPCYHASYRAAGRETVLGHVALYQLDARLHADALAVVRARRYYEVRYDTSREGERANAFLDEYNPARDDSTHTKSEWLACRSMTEALDLVDLNKAVKFVAVEYCRSLASSMGQGQQPTVLSQMEEFRLHRALYRFQLYSNFFGVNPCMAPTANWEARKKTHHPYRRFLASFPPWEILEMACVWQYLMQRWAPLVKELSYAEFTTKHGPDEDQDLLATFTRLDFTGFFRLNDSDSESDSMTPSLPLQLYLFCTSLSLPKS